MVGRRSNEMLGFRVSHGKIQPSDNHNTGIEAFCTPSDVAALLRFLGLVAYLGIFFAQSAGKCAPLYRVLEGTPCNAKMKKKERVAVNYFDKSWGAE